MKFSEKLQQILDSRGFTGYAVSKGTGLPKSTISRLLSGEAATPRSTTLAEIASFLGITPTELISGTELENSYDKKVGKISRGLRVPLLTSPSDASYYATFENDVPINTDFLPPFPFEQNKSKELIAVVIDSDALAPRIRKGDIVYFNTLMQTKNDDCEAKNGDVVLAVVKDEPAKVIIREYYEDDLGERWLVATNPSWPGEHAVRCSFVSGVAVGFSARL